jgi:hypothetical protein
MALFVFKLTKMKYLFFDIRALSLMRICIAAIILFDLGIRMTDLEAFYSNNGVVPLNYLFENSWSNYFISIHTISGLWQVQFILFMAAFFFAIMLFIGYRTQLFTFLSWLMMLSLHNRNGLILQGGDDLLRMVLFWGIFLPWGKYYSCDHLFQKFETFKSKIFTVATIAYLLQICYIYTGSALLKGPEWSKDFSAIYYAYSLDQIAYPITKFFYYDYSFLKKLTFLAYYFELLVPVLFFIPVKHSLFRTAGIFLIITFHLINAGTLFIGLFPFIGIATVVGIFPTAAMDKFDHITLRFREKVKTSFTEIAYYIEYIIRWRAPVYNLNPILEYTKNGCLVFLVLFVFDWNFSNLSFVKSKLSKDLRWIGYSLRLDQNWGMFSPGVFKNDGWYILQGITEKNDTLNLLDPSGKLDYKKPSNIVSMFKNDRWRKYSENFIFSDNENMRGYFCNYYKRNWNRDHPGKHIKTLRVIYMEEMTLPDYKYSIPKKNILWECDEN